MAKPRNTFEKLVEQFNRWDTNFDTGERQFTHEYVRYTEGGRIYLRTQLEIKPDKRNIISRELGATCMLLKQYTGRLVTAEGEPIKKSWIENTPILIDREFNMIGNMGGGWGAKGVYYPHRNAMPVFKDSFTVRKPNRKRAKEVLSAVMDAWVVAVAQYKMGVIDGQQLYTGVPKELLATGSSALAPEHILWLARNSKLAVETAVKYHTSDVVTTNYLRSK